MQTLTQPRVIRGTDLPAGREVASVTAVDPDGEGALINVQVGEYLTPADARALLAALAETLTEVAA